MSRAGFGVRGVTVCASETGLALASLGAELMVALDGAPRQGPHPKPLHQDLCVRITKKGHSICTAVCVTAVITF